MLIVGLGNPGTEYANHRHNIGFMAVDNLCDKWSECAHYTLGSTVVGGITASLLKPYTYMNSSGLAVAAVARFLSVTTENIIVIHDDLDLPFGKVRIKSGGSDGGHRGIRSIIKELASKKFTRVRLGIGKAPEGTQTIDYVLAPFLEEEQERVADLVQVGCKAVNLIIEKGLTFAQNNMNGNLTN